MKKLIFSTQAFFEEFTNNFPHLKEQIVDTAAFVQSDDSSVEGFRDNSIMSQSIHRALREEPGRDESASIFVFDVFKERSATFFASGGFD